MFSFIKNIFKKTLHKACEKGNIEAVKQHLATGTDVNEKEKFTGYTPLIYAAEEGHKQIVELLIAKGADVNTEDNVGRTPLDWAATWGMKEIADLLQKQVGKAKKGQKTIRK